MPGPEGTEPEIVLVVDDSAESLGAVHGALEAAGYTVLVARSGPAALAVAGRATPDLVLMDAVMPGMDGFEACRLLKASGALAAVPVVFMTGLTETAHVLRALEAGGVDYVTKPAVPEEIVARVRVHLANARLTRSARSALDAAGRFLLAADPAGSVRWCTPRAARVLGPGGEARPALPPEARRWVAALAADPGAAPATLALPDAGAGEVEVSFVGRIGADELLLRVAPAGDAEGEGRLRDRFGLTAREAQVLLWIGRGKANRDIGEILGLSPRTVNKHLEQVYQKLGVENRASAAALATRAL